VASSVLLEWYVLEFIKDVRTKSQKLIPSLFVRKLYTLAQSHLSVRTRDVEAVEYFLLPLPTPCKVRLPASFFKVLPLTQKFHRFQLPFHIPALCLMKNASTSGSSKTLMLPSSLPLPASFFKVLPLPQNVTASTASSFRFHIPNLDKP